MASTSIAERDGTSYELWVAENPLRRWRAEAGKGAHEVGALLRVTAMTIYNWEKAASRPSDQNVEHLALMMGMSGKGLKIAWTRWENQRPKLAAPVSS